MSKLYYQYPWAISSNPLFGDNRTYYQHSPNNGKSIQKAYRGISTYLFRVDGDGKSWEGDGTLNKQRSEFCMVSKLSYSTPIQISYKVTAYLNNLNVYDQNYIILGQLHRTPDIGDSISSPPVEFRLHQNGLNVVLHSSINNPSITQIESFYGPYDFKLEEEHQIDTTIKNGPNGTGKIVVCIDGIPKLDLKGVSLGFIDSIGPYFKFGIYTAPRLKGAASIEAVYRDIIIKNE